MKKKNLILIFLIFIMSSCNRKTGYSKEYDYYQKGWCFLKNTKEFEKKNNLSLALYGLNSTDGQDTPLWHDIHGFEVTFESYEELDLDQARKKLINCVHEYLNLINTNELIKPYLHNYPFTYKQLLFRLSFHDKNHEYVNNNFVALVWLNEDRVVYMIKEESSLKYLHKETYQEALKLVVDKK